MSPINEPLRNGGSCDRLDDYYDGLLPADATASFESHLARCAACRAALDQQLWLDDVLRLADAATLEAAPAPDRRELAGKIAAVERREKMRWATVGVAAAAALFVAIGWWTIIRDGREDAAEQGSRMAHVETSNELSDVDAGEASAGEFLDDDSTVDSTNLLADDGDGSLDGVESLQTDGETLETSAAAPAVADFQGDGDVIAVRLESPSPDVTVFEVFPTTDAQRRRELAALLADIRSPSNGEF